MHPITKSKKFYVIVLISPLSFSVDILRIDPNRSTASLHDENMQRVYRCIY